MKRLLIIAFTLLLSGCLERTEINKLGIVSGLGIDKTENGYLVTTQIMNPDAIAGNNSNALPVYGLSEEGETFYEAYQKLDNLTTQVLYLSHLNVIVVDEETAKEGINNVLDFALRHTEVRPDINILVAKEAKAQDVLNVLTSVDNVPAMQLDIFTNMIHMHTARLVNYNLYDVVNLMNTPGVNAVLNGVSLATGKSGNTEQPSTEEGQSDENMEAAGNKDNISEITAPVRLEIKDLAVFNQDKLIGYLTDDDAQFYNILRNENKDYFIKTKIDDEYYISFQAEQTKTEIKTHLKEEKIVIDCKIEGVLVENRYPMDVTTRKNIKALQAYLKEQVEKDLLSFIDKTQTEFKIDIIGIGEKAYYSENEKWSEVQGYWDEIYPELDFEVNVELHLKSVGDIQNIR